MQQRSNTTYNRTTKGQFSYQFKESNAMNKDQHDFILSNKFEYGYDKNGGRRYASQSTTQKLQFEQSEISKIIEKDVPVNFNQSLINKANDTKANFNIKPEQSLENSASKQIGDHQNSFVKNKIDQNDLRISHLPFKNNIGSES